MKKIFTVFVLLSIIGLSCVFAQTEKIFFSKGVASDRDIFMINPDGTGFTQVIQWTGSDEWMPRVSPDGTKLAFISNKIDSKNQIFITNINGSNPVQLTNSPLGTSWGLTWHPDGQYIYFADAAFNDDVRICKIKINGTDFQVVIDHSGSCNNDCGPDINPADSNKILYQFDNCSNPTSSEFVYNLLSQTEQQIINGQNVNAAHGAFRWSPNGSKIIFFNGIYSGWSTNGYELNIMNADGSNSHSITSITGTEGYYYSDWSTDGTRIVSNYFTNNCDFAHYLYVMNIDGSNRTQIYYNDTENIDWPDWAQINSTGIANYSNTDSYIKLYPNPTNDNVNIKSEISLQLNVYNALGKLIQTTNTDVSNYISLSVKGIYLFEFINDKESIYKKVIVR